MVVIVIPLAEGQQGDEPGIAARIGRAVGLLAPDVADRIDTEGRIQDRKRAADAGQHEPSDSTLPSVMEETNDKGEGKADHDDGCIVAVLPHGHGVLHHAGAESFIITGDGIEEPAAMAIPKSPLGIVRISRIITMRMMAQMIRRPFRAGVLQGPATGDQQATFHPIGTFETAMRQEPVVSDGDAQAGQDI